MEKNKVDEFAKNPRKALFILSYPVIIAMLVQTAYNIVDTIFVGGLGPDAIAALTFSFPLFFIFISVNSGIGIGMGSRISRSLGAKDKKGAENAAIHGLLLSLVIAFLIFAIGLPLSRDIFSLFGATENVLQLSIGYMNIIFAGIFFMFPAYVINSILTAEGNTKVAMYVQAAGLTANIILDPIFIYVLGYGVPGAAIATVIAFIITLALYLYIIKFRSYLCISPKCFRFSPALLKEILRIGAPASFMTMVISVYIVFFNSFMAYFGTNYVAAFGLTSRLESLAVLPVVAFSIALMTLVGMFYGARRYDLLKGISWYATWVSVLFSAAIGAVMFLIPDLLLSIFTQDPQVLALASAYIRIDVFTLPPFAVAMCISRILQGMGSGSPGFVITLLRVFITSLPLAYVFVYIFGFGYLSIAVALIIGSIISNVVAIVWLKIKLIKLESA